MSKSIKARVANSMIHYHSKIADSDYRKLRTAINIRLVDETLIRIGTAIFIHCDKYCTNRSNSNE